MIIDVSTPKMSFFQHKLARQGFHGRFPGDGRPPTPASPKPPILKQNSVFLRPWMTKTCNGPLRGPQPRMAQEDVIENPPPPWSKKYIHPVIKRRLSIASRPPLPRSGSGGRRASWVARGGTNFFLKKMDFFKPPGGGSGGSPGALGGSGRAVLLGKLRSSSIR